MKQGIKGSMLMLRWIAIMSLGFFMVRCSSDDKKEAAAPTCGTTFTDVYTLFKADVCTNCHGEGLTANNSGVKLDFSSAAKLYTTLTVSTGASGEGTPQCNGVAMVKSTKPESSYLLAILYPDSYAKTDFAGTANCTPYAGHENQLTLYKNTCAKTTIEGWIKAGASQ